MIKIMLGEQGKFLMRKLKIGAFVLLLFLTRDRPEHHRSRKTHIPAETG
jgi:hypothetical protein